MILLRQNGARIEPLTTTARTRFFIPALASILYFSQGFPFGVVDRTLNVYLTVAGAPLWIIGMLSTVGIAWSVKLFWAPLVDAYGTYRAWIFGALIVLAVSMAAIPLTPAASTAFWIVVIVLALASATQDIALDALTIRITPEEQIGVVNSVRVTAFRIAYIAASGGVASLAGWIGWRGALGSIALVPLLVLAILLFTLPPDAGAGARHDNPVRALLDWLARPGSKLLLAVVLLYRVGDSALRPMIVPFWNSRHFNIAEITHVTSTLGMICTIVGAIAGGWFVMRYGVFRGLLWLGLLQMLSNLGYAFVATSGASGRIALYGASSIETFCDGLGTAAFLSFLMFICERENAATEYAMLSAVFAISRTGAGAVSGFLAQDLGYANYFWLTAALALPGLALLPLIRKRVT